MVPCTWIRWPSELPARSLRASAGQRLQLLAPSLILAGAVLLLWGPVQARATSSLWTDELHTILFYSSRGPAVTVTDYHEPNNHIFFNLLNSITPGRSSVGPLRARAWSFAAMAGTLLATLAYFHRRRQLLCGAVFAWTLCASPELVDLVLQARGYGFLAFFALIACLALTTFLEREKSAQLALLGASCILGSYTVPTFGFFAVGVWTALLIARPRLRVALAALASGALTLLIHLPVLGQMLEQARNYDQSWGRQFEHLRAVSEVLRIYLLHPSVLLGVSGESWVVAAFVICLLGLLGNAWRLGRAVFDGPAVIAGACVVFFLICLWLETPLLRSTAFIVVPIGFCFASVAASAIRIPSRPVRYAAAALLALLLFRQSVRAARGFHFVPEESWKDVAQVIRETFPPGIPVVASANSEFLSGYLEEGDALDPGVRLDDWARGQQIYLDTPLVDPPDGRVDGRSYAKNAVEFRFAQRRLGYHSIWLCPPLSSSVVAACSSDGSDVLPSITDRDLPSGSPEQRPTPAKAAYIQIELPRARYRSLVVVSEPGARFEAQPCDAPAGSGFTGRVRQSGEVSFIPLGDQVASCLRVVPARSSSLPSIRELWAYPTNAPATPRSAVRRRGPRRQAS